jgi:hypothetical protein
MSCRDVRCRQVKRHRAAIRAGRCGAAFIAVACSAGPALADETRRPGAGLVGGALLAAEATLLAEALLNVEPAWVYWVSAAGAAALGGYVGWRIEQRTEPEVPASMLGAGVVFVIPTSVWFGNSRAPRAPDGRR